MSLAMSMASVALATAPGASRSKISGRDQVLAVLLPALVVIVGWIWLGAGPLLKELKKAEESLVKAREAEPKLSDIRRAAKANAALEAEIKRLEQAETAAHERLHECLDPPHDADFHSRNLAGLVALLTRHGLSLRETHGETRSGLVPASLSELERKHKLEKTHQIWTLRIAGEYLAMHAALSELAERSSAVLPIHLSLDPVEPGVESGPAPRLWTLTVWL